MKMSEIHFCGAQTKAYYYLANKEINKMTKARVFLRRYENGGGRGSWGEPGGETQLIR